MPNAPKSGWYAVAVGRFPGLYTTWAECNDQVKGFSGAKFKKFSTKSEAEGYIKTWSESSRAGPVKSSFEQASHRPVKRTCAAFYAVARGRNTGVYRTWQDCAAQIENFSNPLFRKFGTEKDAQDFCIRHTKTKSSSGIVQHGSCEYGDLSLSDIDSGDEAGEFSPSEPDENSDCGEREELDNKVLEEIATLICRSNTSQTICPQTKTNRPVVYTDGSCVNQGKGSKQDRRAGIGVYWGPGDSRNLSERLWGLQTNQRAELWAAIRALQAGLAEGHRQLEIRTDSQYTIKGVTEWSKKWKKNDYRDAKGNPVKNKELFCCLASLVAKVDVRWVHVKAHQGDYGNEAADQLARKGANKSSVGSRIN